MWPPRIFLRQSSCYLSLALVCSLLENRSSAVATVRSLVAKKKKKNVTSHSQFSSPSGIGRLRASRLTRTQADLSLVTCERVAQKLSEALHRMNGSINPYRVLIITDKNFGRVGGILLNLLSSLYISNPVLNLWK